MRDLASPGYERAIEAARLIANGAGAAAVDVRHLVLGLFDEADGLAMALARDCGLDSHAWLLRQTAEHGTKPVEPMTLPAETAIRHARRLAREFLADRTVTTDLLLVGVLESDAELAVEFASLGFDRQKLHERVISPLTAPIALVEPQGEIVSRPQPTAQAQPHVHRILDAVGNRAREALRVIEDYARFQGNDGALTRLLKELRHDLTAALATLPRSELLEARNTPDDVGTEIETASEYLRASVHDVVAANLCRLQESLRSLEEYGKIHDPNLGRLFEQLRYRSYTLETRLAPADQLRIQLAITKLYWLVSAAQCKDDGAMIREAIAGGVQIIQLREKNTPDRQLLDAARLIRRITLESNTLLIINDRPDVALAVDADGVHLGQDDLTVRDARKLVGKKLIGVSTHNIEQLKQAIADGADYVGVGPTFPSKTKSFAQLAGLDFVREAAQVPIPAFILGGVALDNIDQVMAAGGRRVAVADAISNAADLHNVSLQLRRRLNEG